MNEAMDKTEDMAEWRKEKRKGNSVECHSRRKGRNLFSGSFLE
jgi:hypothetical protein